MKLATAVRTALLLAAGAVLPVHGNFQTKTGAGTSAQFCTAYPLTSYDENGVNEGGSGWTQVVPLTKCGSSTPVGTFQMLCNQNALYVDTEPTTTIFCQSTITAGKSSLTYATQMTVADGINNGAATTITSTPLPGVTGTGIFAKPAVLKKVQGVNVNFGQPIFNSTAGSPYCDDYTACYLPVITVGYSGKVTGTW